MFNIHIQFGSHIVLNQDQTHWSSFAHDGDVLTTKNKKT